LGRIYLKLNIGCGGKRIKGYTGIDAHNTPAADIVAKAWELPMIKSNSVDEIYTSHMVEHLTPGEFRKSLTEWKRVLKPGGSLVIRCPNFELYVREWLEGDYDYRWGWGITNLLGHQHRGPGMLNRNAFTVQRLSKILKSAGFNVNMCVTTHTRPQTEGKEEYRENGDIYCVAFI
jgi:predicted SAM-dependent methyltransferase